MAGIGPMLPPSMRTGGSVSDDDEEGDIGPKLPSTAARADIGPTLPPHIRQHTAAKDEESDDDDAYGPQLPPGLSLPTVTAKPATVQANQSPKDAVIDNSSSDDDVIGPSLTLAAPAGAQYDAAAEFAARYESLEAEKQRAEDEKMRQAAGREEWMMSLPTLGLAQDIGLTARSFRAKAAPKQDSSWTKAPGGADGEDGEKGEKGERGPGAEKRKYEDNQLSKRDQEIAEKLAKYNESKRQKSLLEMHDKKLRKEKKKLKKERGDEKAERVPFSRETDLQVNKFDEAQRKSILKKASKLDSRFGHGSQKYE